MGKEIFSFEEVNDAVIVYVDKYLKLLMSNVKYSFLEKYNNSERPIYNCVYLKENDIRFSYCDQKIEKILCNTFSVEDMEITVNDDALSDCLNNLSNREREIVLRNVVLRTPLKEIAADMGLSERMVKYCKKKALEKMKKGMSRNEL